MVNFALKNFFKTDLKFSIDLVHRIILCGLFDPHDNTLLNLLICKQLARIPRNGSMYTYVYSQSVQTQKKSMLQYRELLKEREGILKKRRLTLFRPGGASEAPP